MTTKFSVASLSLGLFLALQCNVGDANLRDFLPKQLNLMTAVVERLTSIEDVVKKVYKVVNEGNDVKDVVTPAKGVEGQAPGVLGVPEGQQQGPDGAGQVAQPFSTVGYPQLNNFPAQDQRAVGNNDQTGQQSYNQQLNDSYTNPGFERIPLE